MGYALHMKTIPSLDTLSPATYGDSIMYGRGHPPWLGRELEGLEVGVSVPAHDPLRVQACCQATPVPGSYPTRGHQPLAG